MRSHCNHGSQPVYSPFPKSLTRNYLQFQIHAQFQASQIEPRTVRSNCVIHHSHPATEKQIGHSIKRLCNKRTVCIQQTQPETYAPTCSSLILMYYCNLRKSLDLGIRERRSYTSNLYLDEQQWKDANTPSASA